MENNMTEAWNRVLKAMAKTVDNNMTPALELAENGRMVHTIKYLRRVLQTINIPAEIKQSVSDKLESINTTYRYLVKYAIEGVPDPERSIMMQRLKDNLYALAYQLTAITRYARKSQSALYSISYNSLLNHDLLTDVNTYLNLIKRSDLSLDDESITLSLLQKADSTLADIFLKTWTLFPISPGSYQQMRQLLLDDTLPEELHLLLISALTLLLTGAYDPMAIALLWDVYEAADSREQSGCKIAARAITGIVIGMLAHRGMAGHDTQNYERMKRMKENVNLQEDIRHVLLNLAYTRETETINRKVNDEILPELNRARTDIMSGLKDIKQADLENLDSIEENPQWQKILGDNKLSDKLKQLSEWQMDGADVMMSAFAGLKNNPFFASPGHWFLPFGNVHLPEFEKLKGDNNTIMKLLASDASGSIMCDSDKYSFLLAFTGMPDAQRNILLSQLSAQLNQLKEEQKASLKFELKMDMEKEVCRVVRNLFRFFRQYSRRAEFDDPFTSHVDLEALNLLPPISEDGKLAFTLAEFYMTRGFHSDAVSIYKELLKDASETRREELLQKIGFCLQKAGNVRDALKYYDEAEIINPDSKWLLKQIALCHKRLGDYYKAAAYYQRLLAKSPDSILLTLSLANCLLETENYDDALKLYFKADYFDDGNIKVLRPLAWTLFILGRLDESSRVYRRILSSGKESAQDFLAHAHLLLKQNKLSDAVAEYVRATKMYGSEKEFMQNFAADTGILLRLGIDPEIIQIIPDAICYGLE